MARKKKHPEHINHERWLVSYADFITLLFAFFVVMFAVSQVDSKKVGRFTQSFSKAVGVDVFPQPGRGIMPGVSNGVPSLEDDPSKTSAMPAELDGLQANLTTPGEDHQQPAPGVQVIARRNELVLRLSDGLLFESGTDALKEPAILVLQKLAIELKKRNVDVRVEGHTDPRPIRSGRFRSNWELSTARATAVVARLAAEGLLAKRLSAAGYGEFHPIAPNTTDEGMRKNRRVDLVVSVTAKEAVETVLKEATEKPEKSEKSEKKDPAEHGEHGDEPKVPEGKSERGARDEHAPEPKTPEPHAAHGDKPKAPEHGEHGADKAVTATPVTPPTDKERVEKLEKEMNEVLAPARDKHVTPDEPKAPAAPPAAPAHESHEGGHAPSSHESHDSKPNHHE